MINNSIKYAIIKNNSINLNQSNNFCLNALKNKDLVCTKSLQTAYHLHFLMLLLPPILTLKSTIFRTNFY